jgi:hypothetical protein
MNEGATSIWVAGLVPGIVSLKSVEKGGDLEGGKVR